jgi:hypothetical protein
LAAGLHRLGEFEVFMASTHEVTKHAERTAHGPHIALLGSVAIVFALLTTSDRMLPADVTLPAAVMLLFGLAAILAVMAWRQSPDLTPARLNYWDVAGALVLIGIALSALIEPEQIVRLVEGADRKP